MGFVYILRVGDRNVFKIGKATDLDRRLKAHATSSADRLSQFDVIETEQPAHVERYLKHRLRSRRYAGTDATEIYDIDPDELVAVIADARQWANEDLPAVLRASVLSHEVCDDRILVPTAGISDTYTALVKVREEQDTLGFRRERLEADMKLFIDTASGIEGMADFKTVVKPSFNVPQFKVEYPDLYPLFVREIRTRPFNLH